MVAALVMVDIPEFVTPAELVMVAAAATAVESVAEEAESVALLSLDIPESVAVDIAEAVSAVAVAVALTEAALPALAVIVTVM